jgi:transporter family protein
MDEQVRVVSGLLNTEAGFMDWRFFAFSSAFFAALTAIFGKIGVSEINSDLATFIRTIVILLVAALFVSFRGEWKLSEAMASKTVIFLILSGLATGLSWLCYYRALQLGPVSKVAPVDKLSVALVLIFSAVFLHEKMDWKTALGGLLVTAGAVILALG